MCKHSPGSGQTHPLYFSNESQPYHPRHPALFPCLCRTSKAARFFYIGRESILKPAATGCGASEACE